MSLDLDDVIAIGTSVGGGLLTIAIKGTESINLYDSFTVVFYSGLSAGAGLTIKWILVRLKRLIKK